jgi:hypothetical protein
VRRLTTTLGLLSKTKSRLNPFQPPVVFHVAEANLFAMTCQARVVVGWLADLSVRCATELPAEAGQGACDLSEVANCMSLGLPNEMVMRYAVQC